MALDSSNVVYSLVPLTYINVNPGMSLQTALQNINTAVNTHNTAPDYSGYNLGPYFGYTITQTDGTSHPTNTQNFAEGISKILCKTEYDLYTFTGTTYVSDQLVITNAINALQTPALTYSASGGGGSISITSGMTRNQVLTATYTGVGNIFALLNAPGTTWASLSITTPTNISTAFNDLITYLGTLTTTVSGKQATIGTFNATSIGGGATDNITVTVGELITFAAALPTFTVSGMTWGCVPSETTLTTTVQSIINTVSSQVTNSVVGNGTGLNIATIGSCAGKSLSIDTTYTQLYKVMLSTGDTYSNAGFLDTKIKSSDSSLTFATSGNKLDITVTNPNSYKVKVDSSDTTAGYLSDKLQNGSSAWGLSNIITPAFDSSSIQITPSINPDAFFAQMLDYISQSPVLFTRFQQLVLQSQGGTCASPTALTVALTGGNFVLTWAPSGSAASQQTKWRPRGVSDWNSSNDISPANPQTNSIATSTVTGSVGINNVIQFVVDSLCVGGGVGTSNQYEMIKYVTTASVFTHTIVGASPSAVISVNQNPLPGIDNIQYRLKDSGAVVVQNITATGSVPNASFAPVSSDTYSVEYRFGTMVNGVTLYSDDSSQLNAWIAIAGIIVP